MQDDEIINAWKLRHRSFVHRLVDTSQLDGGVCDRTNEAVLVNTACWRLGI